MTKQEESRHSIHSDSKQTSTWKLMGVISVLVAIVLGAGYLFAFGPLSQQYATAQQAVDHLFTDDSHVYLEPELTAEDLDQAQQSVEQLRFSPTKSQLLQDVHQAKQKYVAIETLEAIFVHDEPIVSGSVIYDCHTLKPDLTPEVIHAKVNAVDLPTQEDPLTKELGRLLAHGDHLATQLTKAQEQIDQLPDAIGDDASIDSIIAQLKEIEALLADLGEQPFLHATRESLSKQVALIGDSILSNNQAANYDQEIIDEIFSVDLLAKNLLGTELDTQPSVALTFDDGPNLEVTPQILDILAKHDVKATFFVLGPYVEDHPEMAQRIHDEGHLLGNHSYTHPVFDQLTDEEVIQEIEWTQESIEEVTGYTPHLYRMPFGAGGERVVNLFPDYTSIIWNVDSEDWMSQDADAIYQQVMDTMQLHSIVLMHDTHQATADALDRVITSLKEQGYRFVFPEEVGFEYHYY